MDKILGFFILLFCISGPLFAATVDFNCLPNAFQIEDKNVLLKGTERRKQSVVYFFNNTSNQSVWIDHPNLNPGASAGWSSYIRPHHWSALVLNKKNFLIDCAVIKPGHLIYLDCSKVLNICAPKAGAMTKHGGNFWLVEDKTEEDFLKAVEKRGL